MILLGHVTELNQRVDVFAAFPYTATAQNVVECIVEEDQT